MSVEWPEFMPQSPLLEGYNERPRNTVLRTNVDAGLPQIRNRFTAAPDDITERYLLDLEQYEQFKQWFKNEAKRGSLEIDKPSPVTGEIERYRFDGTFRTENVGNLVRLTIEWEQLP